MVVMRNRVFDCNHGNSELFESWRQLVEVALHSLGQVGVKSEVKVAVLFELIQDLLLKVRSSMCQLHSCFFSVHCMTSIQL